MIEEVLASAPPPWHSIALIGSVLAIFVQMLPSWDEIDQVATLDTFSKSEAWIGGPLQLGIYRFIIALTIWSTSLYLLCGPGWSLLTSWKPGSKLRSGATIRLQGIKTMFPFTSWSWNMLGLSYSLNALIALSVATGQDVWIAKQLALEIGLDSLGSCRALCHSCLDRYSLCHLGNVTQSRRRYFQPQILSQCYDAQCQCLFCRVGSFSFGWFARPIQRSFVGTSVWSVLRHFYLEHGQSLDGTQARTTVYLFLF